MSSSLQTLVDKLKRLERQNYKAYKQVKGRYDAQDYALCIDYVQGDPFATPSQLCLEIPHNLIQLPDWATQTKPRCISTADYLNRALRRAFSKVSRPRGTGGGGRFEILNPGQEVLARTSVIVSEQGDVEVRFRAGLPAFGRRIAGHDAAEMMHEDIPWVVEHTLASDAVDHEKLRTHVECVEDAQALRDQLTQHNLVAFVGNDTHLPRASGIDDRPLSKGVVPFASPESLAITLQAPNAGAITGMGIPKGVTLIVGGGYHGKSTLLNALQRGVYDHIPDDGRERVVTVADAVKVRAEDGRSVAGTDLRNFINNLPHGGDTERFVTNNASGSTSQAAAVIEALEMNASCLLLDEDTSATNFMIRDARMQALIAEEHEPITPYIDRIRTMADELNVSTIIVVGGSGDYFDVCDTVIAMKEYKAFEVTQKAKSIAQEKQTTRTTVSQPWSPPKPRTLNTRVLDPSKGRKDESIKIMGDEKIVFGRSEIPLWGVEQLVERGQARAIGAALARLAQADPARNLELFQAFTTHGDVAELDKLARGRNGELTAYRTHELAAVANRMRILAESPNRAA